MPPLEVFPVALAGGLEDSKAQPDPGDLSEAFNLAIFRDRLALRAPTSEIATIQDDQGTPQDVTSILDIKKHAGLVYVVSHSTNTNKVYLHSMEPDGDLLTLVSVVWTSITQAPTVSTASIEGGTASSGTTRFYISDYDQNESTKYWDGSTMNTLSVDLDNDDSAGDVQFSLVAPYNFHLWGSGWYTEGAATRPELLRFSQPGLVPGTDPAGGSNPKEWWHADHRGVGRRGEKITALSYAGGRLVVFKEDETHVLHGYDATSWAIQELSDKIGAVGPNAATTANTGRGRICFFWSNDGPYVTDGTQVRYIGMPIRQRVINTESDENVAAQWSPEDGMVYFVLKPAGLDEQTRYLAFDVNNERWVEGEWFDASGNTIQVGASGTISSTVLPGPEGDPTNLTLDDITATTADLSWSNGDVNLSTVTHIYRSTSTGFTPSSGNRVGIVQSGVSEFTDTGLTGATEYFWKVRHFRHQQHSGESNEVSGTTLLATPTNLVALSDSAGAKLEFTQNNSESDIEVERREAGSTNFSLIDTVVDVSSGTANYTDDDVTCGAEFVYRVKAVEAGFTDSEYSNEDSTVTCADAAVAPLSNFEATVSSDAGEIGLEPTVINLSWDESNTGTSDDTVVIERQILNSLGSAVVISEFWLFRFHEDSDFTTRLAYDGEWECPGGWTGSDPGLPGVTYILKYFENNEKLIQSITLTISDVCAIRDTGTVVTGS